MHQKKKKYLLSFVVIGSILTLSFQNTLGVFHTLLHHIPNPIHYHGEGSLSHYHHTTSQGNSFFAHETHTHSHSLEDHVHGSQKEGLKSDQKKKSEQREKEEMSKALLFLEELKAFVFVHKSIQSAFPANDSLFSHSPESQLGPPPEIGA